MSESKDAPKDNETNGFKNALFVNPISRDSDMLIEDIHEGMEGINLGLDKPLVKTPTSNEGRSGEINFNNLLSSDLMKKLEAGSPIKSNRTFKKIEKDNDEDDEIERSSSNIRRGSDYSLFYSSKKHQENDFKMNPFKPVGEEEAHGIVPPVKLPEESSKSQYSSDELFFNIPEAPKYFGSSSKLESYGQKQKSELKNYFNEDQQMPREDYFPSSLNELSDDVSYYPKSFMMNNQNSKSLSYQKFQQYPQSNHNEAYMQGQGQGQGHFQDRSANYRQSLSPSFEVMQRNEGNNSSSGAGLDNTVNNYNRSYTMYGKTGWICSMCKNFNYEIRVKCNRCGKPQMRPPMYPRVEQKANLMLNNSQAQIDLYNQMVLMPNDGINLTISEINKINQMQINQINKMTQMRQNQLKQHQEINPTRQIKNTITNTNISTNNSSMNANMNMNMNMNMINNSNVNVYQHPNEMINSNNSSVNNSPPLTKPNTELPAKDKEQQGKAAEGKKKKKPFVERVGDWVCIKCKNLNFSFRVICNRCQLTKIDSEKLFEQYMKSLMNYVKLNEVIQNQFLTKNMKNLTNANSNFYHVNNSFNTFYPNKTMISNPTSPIFDVNSSKDRSMPNAQKFISANRVNSSNKFSPRAEYSTEGSNSNAYNSENLITEDATYDKFSNLSK